MSARPDVHGLRLWDDLVTAQLKNEWMFFFFFLQKTKNVFFNSVPCYFGVLRSSNWMLQQAIFHHHNFWFSVKKNGVQQTLFATDCHYSLCPKLASSPIQVQCLKMKISFLSAPGAHIRLHCGVVPAYWCDKCSSPLLFIRTESVTCSNIVKVHRPYTDFLIAKAREIMRGEKWLQLPYEITECSDTAAQQPHITNNDHEWNSCTRIMMSFVLAGLWAPWYFKLFISSTRITQTLCSTISPHSPVIWDTVSLRL